MSCLSVSFYFTDPPTTDIYTLSLHDALPICTGPRGYVRSRPTSSLPSAGTTRPPTWSFPTEGSDEVGRDRKSTRLNSSHVAISYAVFCLKKKKTRTQKSEKITR